MKVIRDSNAKFDPYVIDENVGACQRENNSNNNMRNRRVMPHHSKVLTLAIFQK